MSSRIEISFVGEAPESELDRAHILAAPDVTASIKALQAALTAAGFKHEATARIVRELGPRTKTRKPQPPQMRVQGAQAAE